MLPTATKTSVSGATTPGAPGGTTPTTSPTSATSPAPTGSAAIASSTGIASIASDDYSFSESPTEIDAFVDQVGGLRDTMAGYAQDLAGLQLDDGVFGRLPSISSKMYDAYAHHIGQCTAAFADGKDVLDRLASRAKDAATSYRDTEAGNVAAVTQLARQIPMQEA